MRRGGAGIAVIAVCLVATAGSSSARSVGALAGATALGGYDGWLGFSERVGDGPRYRLVLRNHGRLTRPRLSTQSESWDVALGPDGKNRTVAVYSRCRQSGGEPPGRLRGDARGCELFEYDPRSGHETALRDASTAEASETLPGIWRTTIVFVRTAVGKSQQL